MKKRTTTTSKLKRELIILAMSCVAALFLNIYSLVKSKTDWSEISGQLHVVVMVAIIIYGLVLVFRLLFSEFSKLIQKK